MKKNVCIVGLHIPKCAGSSILKGFSEVLKPQAIYQNTSLLDNYLKQRPEFFELNNYSNLQFMFGHHIYDEMLKCLEKIFLFTLLRDPVERGISDYYFACRLRESLDSNTLSIEEYISKNQSIVHFITTRFSKFIYNKRATSVEKAIQILSHFDFVGTTENVAELIKKIDQIFGINIEEHKSNVSQNDYKNDKFYNEIKNAISEKFKDDIQLYKILKEKKNKSRYPDNPFHDSKRLNWRNNEFLKMECDFELVKHMLTPHYLLEYHRFNILNDYIAINKRKINFYSTIENRMYPKFGLFGKIINRLSSFK